MKSPRYVNDSGSVPTRVKAPRHIANFDSATATLRATGRYLRGKPFPQLGVMDIEDPCAPPMPGPFTLGKLDVFLQAAGDRYPVRWE